MSTKGWIVLRAGAEYNDEIYSLSDGGEPEKVYLDKAKAEARVLELFHDTFKSGFSFGEYAYDIMDIVRTVRTKKELIEAWNKIVPETYRIQLSSPPKEEDYDEWIDFAVGPGITLEQTKKLIKLFSLNLFYIEETEIE